jgi:hypothetical protein
VAEEKLDLLQLAASGTAESSTTPAEIVRREPRKSTIAQ